MAEFGLSVSNRQIGEAAGQGNNSVVGYHFGTKADLVVAVVRFHALDIERRRADRLSSMEQKPGLEAWLAAMVKPMTEHLDSLGTPSWYARFLAQVTEEPTMRQAVFVEMMTPPSMARAAEGLWRALPVLPVEVHAERGDMMRHVLVHALAERERALHAGEPTPRPTWDAAADGLIDGLLGLWSAPCRAVPARKRRRTT